MDVGGTALLADGRAANHWMVESLTALAALLTFMFLVILFCITLGAVSYTHLDVYKRQEPG